VLDKRESICRSSFFKDHTRGDDGGGLLSRFRSCVSRDNSRKEPSWGSLHTTSSHELSEEIGKGGQYVPRAGRLQERKSAEVWLSQSGESATKKTTGNTVMEEKEKKK